MAGLYQFSQEERRILEESFVPMAVYQAVDGRTVTLLVTDGFCELIGVCREDALRLMDDDMYARVFPEETDELVNAAVRFSMSPDDDSRYNMTYHETFADGTVHVMNATGRHKRMKDGTRLAFIRYEDITASISGFNDQTQNYFDNLRSLYDSNPDAMAIVSTEGSRLLYSNKAFRSILKPVRSFDMGITFWEYFYTGYSRDDDFFSGLSDKGGTIFVDPGTKKTLIMNVRPVKWNMLDSYMVELAEKSTAYFDVLTGLPNHYYYEAQSGYVIQKIFESGRAPVCVFFDITGIKQYNSKYGYEKGDELLKEVAGFLAEKYPDRLVMRIDNDHFLVIDSDVLEFDDQPSDAMIGRARQIHREVVRRHPDARIEVKAGIYLVKDEDETPAFICDNARIACESIRNDSTRSVAVFGDDLKKHSENKKYISENIDEALSKGHIKVYYQPVVRPISNRLCGMEALARWQSPVLGFLSPGEFIPVLEETGQIHKLDSYVIGEICRKYRERADRGLDIVPVSFNLSRLDFLMCDIFSVVEDAVRKYSIPRDMIHVEITESIVMFRSQKLHLEMEKFHDAGYQIWMDDFGSGYSSINVLKNYDFDEIKLDMEFLSGFSDSKTKSIITSCIEMAKNIGIQTLAEGVETKEQFEFLKNIGCEKVQGYYFGKPDIYENSLKVCIDKGILPETESERDYYDTVGKVSFASNKPMILFEYDDGIFRICHIGRICSDIFASLGAPRIDDIENIMNNRDLPTSKQFTDYAERLTASGDTDEMVFTFNGDYLKCDITCVANINGRRMYMSSIYNMSLESGRKTEMLDSVLRNIYHIFSEIYVHHLRENYTEQIYGVKRHFFEGANIREYGIAEAVESYARAVVHPDDRRYVRRYMHIDKIAAKLKSGGSSGCLNLYIRCMNEKSGEYEAMMFTTFAAINSSEDMLITIGRRIDDTIPGITAVKGSADPDADE